MWSKIGAIKSDKDSVHKGRTRVLKISSPVYFSPTCNSPKKEKKQRGENESNYYLLSCVISPTRM